MHKRVLDVEVFGIVKHCNVLFTRRSPATGILIAGFWGCE
jgi:hypothetical protein